MTPERTAQLSLTGTMDEKFNNKRIKNMIDALLKAAGGDYTIRLDISDKNDEVDTFAVVVNTLIGRIEGAMVQRDRLDEALTESLDKYRHLVEIIPGMVYLYMLNSDNSFSFPYVSPAARDMFGIDPAEIMNNPAIIFNFIHPDDAEMVTNFIRNSARTLSPFRKEFRYLLNGNTRWCECISRPELLPGGGIIWEGIILDITERKIIEDTLKGSEKRYRMIAEYAHDIIWTMNFDMRMTFISPSIVRVIGYTPEETRKLPLERFMTRESIDLAMKTLSEELTVERRGGPVDLYRSRTLELELFCKRGGTVWVENIVSFSRDEKGTAVEVMGLSRDITERKKADEVLRNSEEKYRSILENMNEGFFECDLKGNYTFFNDACCRLIGYDRGEIMGTNYKKIHPSGVADYLKEVYIRVYKTGMPEYLMDYDVVRKDGSLRTHQLSVMLMRDASGKPFGFRNLVRDVTESKKAEEALKKYRNILETIEEAYSESDLAGNYTFANSAACRLTGYERGELIGMNYRKLHSPDVAQRLKGIFQDIYKTGKSRLQIEHEIICKDGTIKTLNENAMLLKDPSGKPTGFYNLAWDITKQKKAEEDLRKSEEKYRTILETIEDSYTEVDLKGNYTFVNDAACRFLGYRRNELIGMNYRNIHPPETAKRMKEIYKRVYETGKSESLIEFEVVLKDGSIRIHESTSSLIHDPSGSPAGFRVLSRDITDRKKAEQERARLEGNLRQAQKMESVGRLAGGVAHDFNNMLSVIFGYAELIKSRLKDGDPMLKEVQEIENAAGRSRDLTRQLLAFSRKQAIAPRPIDLNELIEGMQNALARLIGEDIDLRFYHGDGLWQIMFDTSQIEQVLFNLAVNARDAMPDGGKLTIETQNICLDEDYCKMHPGFIPGPFVLLGVSDDGAGMDGETLQNAFEPFFTTKEQGKGTGLGLAMVYGIVKQNGGFINIYSEQGRGTSFKIFIPKILEEGESWEKNEESPAITGTGTVLIVEDDDMVRKIASEMLEAVGYTVIAIGKPEEALALCGDPGAAIDLLITDVIMPGMSGKELRDRVELTRPGIKVLFMSGYTSDVIAHRGVLEEGVHFLQKPFSMNDLARKVRDLLNDR
jgi:two-component system cell cycle sensor histidine kinase/response regulator CckA